MRIWCATALLICLHGPAFGAARQTVATEVAASKVSLIEAADRAFVQTWEELQADAETAQLTATEARAASRWVAPGFSLGLCHEAAKASVLATWYSKFDSINFGVGDLADHARAGFRQKGATVYEKGLTDASLASLTATERTRFCRIELEAVRQYLAEM